MWVDHLEPDLVEPRGVEDQRALLEVFLLALLVAEQVQDPVRVGPHLEALALLEVVLQPCLHPARRRHGPCARGCPARGRADRLWNTRVLVARSRRRWRARHLGTTWEARGRNSTRAAEQVLPARLAPCSTAARHSWRARASVSPVRGLRSSCRVRLSAVPRTQQLGLG